MILNDYLYWQGSLTAFLHITKHTIHFPGVLRLGDDIIRKRTEIGFNELSLLKSHIFLKMKNAMYNIFSCM